VASEIVRGQLELASGLLRGNGIELLKIREQPLRPGQSFPIGSPSARRSSSWQRILDRDVPVVGLNDIHGLKQIERKLLLRQSRRHRGPLELLCIQSLQNPAHPLEQLGVRKLGDEEVDHRLCVIDRQAGEIGIFLLDLNVQVRLLKLDAQCLCVEVCELLLLLPVLPSSLKVCASSQYLRDCG
jgi:hypothetical protein